MPRLASSVGQSFSPHSTGERNNPCTFLKVPDCQKDWRKGKTPQPRTRVNSRLCKKIENTNKGHAGQARLLRCSAPLLRPQASAWPRPRPPSCYRSAQLWPLAQLSCPCPRSRLPSPSVKVCNCRADPDCHAMALPVCHCRRAGDERRTATGAQLTHPSPSPAMASQAGHQCFPAGVGHPAHPRAQHATKPTWM